MHRLLPIIFLLALALFACNDDYEGVGSYCDHDGDCETGLCYTDSNPGYCTTRCDSEGSLRQCTDGTICKRIHGGPRRCIVICESDSDCAPNSECNNVRGSGFRGCEPHDD